MTASAVRPGDKGGNDTPIPVSVIVMTKNEAPNLPRCLNGLVRFGQVLVVDSDSEDETAAIATDFGAVVVSFHWDGGYPKKKQWCLDRLLLAHDWVLFVDADEVVTADLAEEIKATLSSRHSSQAGYFIEGRYEFLGRPLRFGHRNRKLALLDRRRARFPECDDLQTATMWEVEGHYQPVVDGRVGCLRAHLLHADQKPIYALFERHNRYSDWEAALIVGGRRAALDQHEPHTRRIVKTVFRHTPLRYILVFLHCYFWKLGILDGPAGFHFALFRAFYYWQIAVKVRSSTAPQQSAAVLRGISRRPVQPPAR